MSSRAGRPSAMNRVEAMTKNLQERLQSPRSPLSPTHDIIPIATAYTYPSLTKGYIKPRRVAWKAHRQVLVTTSLSLIEFLHHLHITMRLSSIITLFLFAAYAHAAGEVKVGLYSSPTYD